MRLISTIKQILNESNNKDILEFPGHNFVAVLFPSEHKVQLSPIDPGSTSTRIRSLMNQLKDKFQVTEVIQVTMNMFDIKFAMTDNFEEIKQFILKHGKQ